MTATIPTPETGFYTSFRGQFSGILRWPQLDSLWAAVKKMDSGDWYVYAVGEPVPQQTASSGELEQFLSEVDALLHKEHDEDYCGIVYTDNTDRPEFVKIFDPNNLGVVCGFSDNPPLPGWILSKIKPEPLENLQPLPGNRKRWWKKIWGG